MLSNIIHADVLATIWDTESTLWTQQTSSVCLQVSQMLQKVKSDAVADWQNAQRHKAAS